MDFNTIYRRTWPYVRKVVADLGVPSRDLDDICHDVFLVALRKGQHIELDPGTEHFWLRQVSLYMAAAYRRRASRRLELLLARAEDLPHQPPVPDQSAALEHAEILAPVLKALRRREAEILALHVVGGLSFRTLGEVCECDPKTARKRYLSASKRAKSLIPVNVARRSKPDPIRPDQTPAENSAALIRNAGLRAHRRRTAMPGLATLRRNGVSDHFTEKQPSHSASPLTPLACDDALSIGLAGRVLLTHWRSRPTRRSMDLLLAQMEVTRNRLGGCFTYLEVFDASWQTPKLAERSLMLELIRCHGSDWTAYAAVSPAESLLPPIMRTLLLLAGAWSISTCFTSTLDHATSWLFATLGVETDVSSAEALLGACHGLVDQRR